MRTRDLALSHMSPNRFSNLTIVVVEDHDDARRYLGLFLDRLGANVVVARNGFEGLEAIKNNRPNLVVSDIQMPGMDGFELLHEIRALGPDAGGSVPVIAMTAFGHARRSRAITAWRVQGMLAKAVHSRQVSGDDSECAQRLSGRFSHPNEPRIYSECRSASPITCAIFSVVSARISDAFETASACGNPASSSSLLAVSIRKRAAIIEEETSS